MWAYVFIFSQVNALSVKQKNHWADLCLTLKEANSFHSRLPLYTSSAKYKSSHVPHLCQYFVLPVLAIFLHEVESHSDFNLYFVAD